MPNKIWHPNDINSAQWFMEGAELDEDSWQKTLIPSPGTADFLNLPEPLKNVLRLDSPDLIVTMELNNADVPILSVEITTTTPQSQHFKQRIPRLIAAAEADIPAIYIIPKRKRTRSGNYSLGADAYFTTSKIQQIHHIPVLVYHYPDDDGHLISDSRFPNQPRLSEASTQRTFRTIKTVIRDAFAGRDSHSLCDDPWIRNEIAEQRAIGDTANVEIGNYSTLTLINTRELGDFLKHNTNMRTSRIRDTMEKLPDRITKRAETLIFRPSGRLFQHAGDPYVGMLAFFDYAFCRTGRGVEDRNRNIIHMPVGEKVSRILDEFATSGYHKFWENDCPFRIDDVPTADQQFRISHCLQYGCVFTKIKPLRILGYFSDMIVFQDSVLVF